MAHSRNSPMRVVATLRRNRAVKLRVKGMTYEEIARRLGCNPETARKDIERALAEVRAGYSEDAREQLQMDLMRLDGLIRAYWKKAMQDKDVKAAELLLKTLDRRAKLLGLNAPTRVEAKHELSGLSDSELLSEAKKLGLAVGLELEEGASGGSPLTTTGEEAETTP